MRLMITLESSTLLSIARMIVAAYDRRTKALEGDQSTVDALTKQLQELDAKLKGAVNQNTEGD